MVPWQKCITVCFCKKLKGFSSKFKIPEGVNAAAGNPSSTSAQANNNRICGREFTTAAESIPRTICSKLKFFLNYIHCNPFMMQQKKARRKHPCVIPKKVAFLV